MQVRIVTRVGIRGRAMEAQAEMRFKTTTLQEQSTLAKKAKSKTNILALRRRATLAETRQLRAEVAKNQIKRT